MITWDTRRGQVLHETPVAAHDGRIGIIFDELETDLAIVGTRA